MDLNRIVNMILNIVLRRAINTGINKGINHFAGKGKPASEMSDAERKQAADARALTKRARQAARITRRLGR